MNFVALSKIVLSVYVYHYQIARRFTRVNELTFRTNLSQRACNGTTNG